MSVLTDLNVDMRYAIMIEDGKYRGFMKGYEVRSDELDSGFQTTKSIRGTIECTIEVHDGKIKIVLPDGSEHRLKKKEAK